ncbi:MAG: aldose 1-epimerase family protein [Christensenella sp.]
MELFGKRVTKEELTKRVGDMSQIADAREGVLSAGKADGVRVIDVKTGGGFSFSILPSRGMDIAWADYKGIPVAYIGKSGVVSPAYFEKDGLNFFRGFFAGLMTTCGLTYMGAPCTDEGQELGLHGRISNTPAYDVAVSKEWEGDDYIIRIRGKMAESSVFGENMVLTREMTVKMGEACVHIHDHVENCGHDEKPFMLLYHCNFGYPIVSEDAVLYEPDGTKVRARDAEGEQGIERFMKFEKPIHGYNEQVFYHDIPKVKDDDSYACLFNEKLGLGGYVKFNREQFTHFGEWKMMGEGDYVVGLEPSNNYPEGRDKARERGQLNMLKPGETKDFDFTIGVVESKEAILNIL